MHARILNATWENSPPLIWTRAHENPRFCGPRRQCSFSKSQPRLIDFDGEYKTKTRLIIRAIVITITAWRVLSDPASYVVSKMYFWKLEKELFIILLLKRCFISSKDEEIDLVSVDAFYEEAPPDISKPDLTKTDSHQQMLARLDWELRKRKEWVKHVLQLIGCLTQATLPLLNFLSQVMLRFMSTSITKYYDIFRCRVLVFYFTGNENGWMF